MISSSQPKDPTWPFPKKSTLPTQLTLWRRYGMTRMINEYLLFETSNTILKEFMRIVAQNAFWGVEKYSNLYKIKVQIVQCEHFYLYQFFFELLVILIYEPAIFNLQEVQLNQDKFFQKKTINFYVSFFAKQTQQKYKMGPIASKKQSTPNQELKMTHPRFKQARILKQHQQIEISLPFIDEKEVKIWQQKFKKYLNVESLLLPTSYESSKVGFCGNNGVCNVRYEVYPYVLKDEINDRIANNLDPFLNSEIWYILFIVLEAASIFHENNMKLGDIRPINIFINDSGQTKVVNHLSFPNENNNYQKSLFQKEITYLAPQQMKHLLFKSQPRQNFVLAESFSIGLTLIDAVTLSNSEDLYNLSNFRIDYEKLDERKEKLQKMQNLDKILKDIILGLAEVNPEQRLNSDEVFKWLRAFREEILNFQHFQIQQWPFNHHHQNGRKVDKKTNIAFNNNIGDATVSSSRAPVSFVDNKMQEKSTYSLALGGYTPQSFDHLVNPSYSYKATNLALPNTMYSQKANEVVEPIYGQMRLRLQKIDQQLARSRQLFPS